MTDSNPTFTTPENPEAPPIRLHGGDPSDTNLFHALAITYHTSHPTAPSITWTAAPFSTSQEALHNETADIIIECCPCGPHTHTDRRLIKRGTKDVHVAFHDHYLLVGPTSDPGGVQASLDQSEATPEAAVRRAFQALEAYGRSLRYTRHPNYKPEKKCIFFSNECESRCRGTEGYLWHMAMVEIDTPEDAPWILYQKNVSLAEGLRKADEEGIYTLIDRRTFLTVGKEMLKSTRVYVRDRKELRCSCRVFAGKKARKGSVDFLKWMLHEGQAVFESLGKEECGEAFYSRADEEVVSMG